MNGEEYFERITEILKKSGNSRFEHNEGFHGFTPVLVELQNRNDGMTAGEIAAMFNITTARVARMLNTLEEKQFIERIKDDNDKRIIIVRIKDEGKKHLCEFKKQRLEDISYAIEGISDNDLDVFFKVTEKMLERFCELRRKNNA